MPLSMKLNQSSCIPPDKPMLVGEGRGRLLDHLFSYPFLFFIIVFLATALDSKYLGDREFWDYFVVNTIEFGLFSVGLYVGMIISRFKNES